ncbi:MAG: endo-1,4-beta-xylanase, partial [Acidimicrobiales bacterium]
MWQAETFDAETIERELGWAASLGFNTARVFLHNLLWQQDEHAFAERVDRFLTIAEHFGIRPMFVLFDGVWDPHPNLGSQPPARDRIHNSGWVQSPGVEVLSDPARHDELRGYVRGIIERFRDDGRVLAWDLFNEPDSPNPAYGQHEPANKRQLAKALLGKAFRWARESQPSQPLTAGLWRGPWGSSGQLSEINTLMLAESDVISFHSYAPPEKARALIDELDQAGRPLLITE